MDKVNVIAIDGPSGSGKSTISKILSEKLGYEYINTGSMYRLIGLLADTLGIFDNEEQISKLCQDIAKDIRFKDGKIFYKGNDYSIKVHENRVSMLASEVSKRESVRRNLGRIQREIGLKAPSVLEGRDIGTVIFPDAKYKFFLDANSGIRAARRAAQLKLSGEEVKITDILSEIEKRDKNDSERELAPLRKAEDALYIDTSNLSVNQIIDTIINQVKKNPFKKGK